MKAKVIDNNSGMGQEDSLKLKFHKVDMSNWPRMHALEERYLREAADQLASEIDNDILQQMREIYIGQPNTMETQTRMQHEFQQRLQQSALLNSHPYYTRAAYETRSAHTIEEQQPIYWIRNDRS